MNDEQIFSRAVQLCGDERIQFIAQSCGQDPVQRERMEKLLAAHETPDSLLAVDGISSTTAFVNDDSVGQQIGPYKLLQKLGEGGMGAVYLAERQHPVKQRVALKIIKHGMDSKKFVARFEAERQALAMMDHPNIARVYDAGCTQSGRPYLVMELVKGVPITTFCDQNKLSTRERLELFVPVCHAVQHAHQKGIIHRDLKPSNILVAMYDDRPVPKVIDFGLAKAANQQLTDKTLFTEVGSILGTWEYMSPEQAVLNQLDVDTRTDVYALGVILYELLTGVTPLDRKQLREVQLRETLRIIQEVDPPIPSTRVSGLGAAVSAVATYRSTDAAGLSKAIRGDLDWVTMKALEKDRRRRYEAASRLADDVAHVLAGEAVDARPPSLAYTTSKLWNRHKLPISTAASVLCALIVFTFVTSLMWYRGLRLTHELSETNVELSASREIARESLYAFSIESAFQSWELGSLERLEELLRQCVPQSDDEEDLRGFEWRLLNQRFLDSRPAHIFECSSAVNDLDFSLDGKGLVGALENGGVFAVSLDTKRNDTRGIEIHTTSESDVTRPVTDVLFVDNDRFVTRVGESGEKDWSFRVSRLNADWTEADTEQELRVETVASSLWRTELGDVMFHAGGDSAGYRISAEEPVFAGETLEASSVQATAGDLYANTQVTARKLRVFRHSTGEQVEEIPAGAQLGAVSFTSAADRLFASDSTGTWSVRIDNGEVNKSKERITWRRTFDTLAIPKSDWVALAGSDDATVTIYDYVRGETVARFLHRDRVYSLAITVDGRWLASSGRDRLIKIWDINALRQRTHRGAPNYFAPLAVRGDGGAVAFLSSPKSIRLYEIDRDRSTEFLIEGVDDAFSRQGYIRGISLSTDGQQLVAAGVDGSVVIWNTASPAEPRRIKVSQYVRSVALSPNGESLAIGSRGSFSLMQLSNGVLNEIERLEMGTLESAVFSHDGKYLAYGRAAHFTAPTEVIGNRHARVWNIASAPKRHHEYPYPGGIHCVELSPDGRFIAIAGSRNLVKVYELDTHDEVATLKGNGSWLTSVSFSTDGKTIAASSPAGEIKFWRIPTFEPAGSMKVERGLRRIKFGGDGNTLFWSSMDGRLGYYRASPASVLDTSQ